MSVINQMLQDLDARGTAGGEGMRQYIKPVAHEERRRSVRLLVAVVTATISGALLVALGFYLYKRARVVELPPVPAKVVMLPAAAPAAPVVVAAAAEVASDPAATPAVNVPSPAAAKRADAAAPKKAKAAEATKAKRPVADSAAKPVLAAVPPEATRSAAAASAGGRQETLGQRAEGAYRRGLAGLQDGRVSEAVVSLEQALQIDPRHEAARQTLVGLLIENKRTDEAMQQLQLGLALDPRQPALAMLLARLQIERGGSGVETLTRTLPYAGGNGEYQALLGGALQRQQRHREAAEQYQAALRSAPQNGVWWMGLGLSLQAEKRNAEALEAFQKAKASGNLSQELLGFVERRVQQLVR